MFTYNFSKKGTPLWGKNVEKITGRRETGPVPTKESDRSNDAQKNGRSTDSRNKSTPKRKAILPHERGSVKKTRIRSKLGEEEGEKPLHSDKKKRKHPLRLAGERVHNLRKREKKSKGKRGGGDHSFKV